MRFKGVPTIPLLLVASAFAQIPETDGVSKIAGIHYAPLAKTARIQGDIHLRFQSGVVTLVSGHPLLAQTALQNAKSFEWLSDKADVDLTYHFILIDATTSVPTLITVRRGNGLERGHITGIWAQN